MAAKSKGRTIVIRRVKRVAGKHHGGSWKVAYADFVIMRNSPAHSGSGWTAALASGEN